ncbi:MAG TPA: GlsB/YeaQ/YmgE family stress response membrane protein [Egibacteraceae bacterium]|nr:GlsB/YeaQ/YmgE family stress response membrane protein [Egibacteraceae bacterium]
MSLIGFLLIGLIAGAIARFLVPGRDPMGCVGTMLLGVVGSYVGGTLASFIFHDQLVARRADTFIGAVIGSILALLLLRAVSRRR